MRTAALEASVLTLLAGFACCSPVRAQYGTANIPAGENSAPAAGERNGLVSVYPFGYFGFSTTGRPGRDSAGARQSYSVSGRILGAIVSFEKSYPLAGSRSYALGGWIGLPYSVRSTYTQSTGPGAGTSGTSGGSNSPFSTVSGYYALAEAHGKYYFTPEWGAQIGVVGSTSGGGEEVDAFALYNLSSRRFAPGAAREWNIQLGGGLFLDPQPVSGPRLGPSAYVDGSLNLAKNLVLSLSYWYLRDGATDGNRFALGLGRRF